MHEEPEIKDGNTVTCCENSGVKDQSGNELRLCSAIDKERVQAEKTDKCTTIAGYTKTIWDCKYKDCSDQVDIDPQYCTVKNIGTHIH